MHILQKEGQEEFQSVLRVCSG